MGDWLRSASGCSGTVYCDRTALEPEVRRLPVKVHRDKMKGGWIGQIAGVCVGRPTEFRYRDKIMPEDKVPKWTPEMINHAFGRDDLYAKMTFLRAMPSRTEWWCRMRRTRVSLPLEGKEKNTATMPFHVIFRPGGANPATRGWRCP